MAANTTATVPGVLTDLVTINDGDCAWVMTSAALVYLMTPALAFFYGGMVSSKHVMNTLFLSVACMGIVTVQWVLFGYSFAFGSGTAGWGDWSFGGLVKIDQNGHSFLAPTYPLFAQCIFQAAFAVITPALISGAIVGRMKFGSWCIFVFLWSTFCYDGLAHWVWSQNGFLHVYGAIDFAGGTVVHISSGVAGLVSSIILGPRVSKQDSGTEDEHQPHFPFTVLGSTLLWVGWIGFNAGSAGSAGGLAALAHVNTNVAAASAMLTWMALEGAIGNKVTVTGACTGVVVGLVGITPACGFVLPGWAILIGIITAAASFGSIRLRIRFFNNLDDTLDTFTCHGIGGAVGSLLTGCFSQANINSAGFDGAFYGRGIQLWYQLAAVLVTIAYSAGCTAFFMLLLKYTIGIRVHEDDEKHGLDHSTHGERWTTLHKKSLRALSEAGVPQETINAMVRALPAETPSNVQLAEMPATPAHGAVVPVDENGEDARASADARV